MLIHKRKYQVIILRIQDHDIDKTHSNSNRQIIKITFKRFKMTWIDWLIYYWKLDKILGIETFTRIMDSLFFMCFNLYDLFYTNMPLYFMANKNMDHHLKSKNKIYHKSHQDQ